MGIELVGMALGEPDGTAVVGAFDGVPVGMELVGTALGVPDGISVVGRLDGNASAGGWDLFVVKYNSDGVKQ